MPARGRPPDRYYRRPLVAHDVPDLEPDEIAALVATTHAVASRITQATGRGQFRETVARGSHGYLAVYAAGPGAILAVIGTSTLNVGMLQYQVRQVIERIAARSAEFSRWAGAAPARPAAGQAPAAGKAPARGKTQVRPAVRLTGPQALPNRRTSAS